MNYVKIILVFVTPFIIYGCGSHKTSNTSEQPPGIIVDTTYTVTVLKYGSKDQIHTQIEYNTKGEVDGNYFSYFLADSMDGQLNHIWLFKDGKMSEWHYEYDRESYIKYLEFFSNGENSQISFYINKSAIIYRLVLYNSGQEEYIEVKVPYTKNNVDSLCSTYEISSSIPSSIDYDYAQW